MPDLIVGTAPVLRIENPLCPLTAQIVAQAAVDSVTELPRNQAQR
jgi:hypothetical protein